MRGHQHIRSWMPFAWAAVVAIAVASSVMFVAQGGFGGGHAPLDLPIYILALPWLLAAEKLVPFDLWAEAGDFVMVVVLPFTCNLAACGVVHCFVCAMRRGKMARTGTLRNTGDAGM